MKLRLLIAAIVAVVLLAGGVALYLQLHSQEPAALLGELEQLHREQTDTADFKARREDLIMQINLCRGDVITPMIEDLGDASTPPAYRADLVELLAKRNSRSAEDRISQAVASAMKDRDAGVRNRTAYCLASFAKSNQQLVLTQSITDQDDNVRRQAYMVVMSAYDPDDLTAKQVDTLVRDCQGQMAKERDPEMKMLARSVLGRVIADRCEQASKAFQSGGLSKAQKILAEAIAMDEGNLMPKVRLVRMLFKSLQPAKALEMGRSFGCTFEVPQLSQAPKIDGDPNDPVWSTAMSTNNLYSTTSYTLQRLSEGKSKVMMGHKDGMLYVCVINWEEHLEKLAMRQKTRDSEVCTDDCAEFIFDPPSAEKGCSQVIVNLNDAIFDHNRGDQSKNFKVQAKSAVYKQTQYGVQTWKPMEKARGYWVIEMAIDGKELSPKEGIKSGTVWSMNIYRVRIGPASEHAGIGPVFGWAMRTDFFPLIAFK